MEGRVALLVEVVDVWAVLEDQFQKFLFVVLSNEVHDCVPFLKVKIGLATLFGILGSAP